MSFEVIEESRDRGLPVELFFFQYGSTPNSFYAYTDAEGPVVFNGVTYAPVPISRTAISASGSMDKSVLTISCPSDIEISRLFATYPPGGVVSTFIRQGHLNDEAGEFTLIWSGRITQRETTGQESKLSCEPISSSMRRAGLRRNYQLGCPHVLYGPQCGASKPNATISRQVLSRTATRITLQDGWSGAVNPNKYLGGMVEWATGAGFSRRMILRIVDLKTLVLTGPTTGIANGQQVDVVLGCNRQMGVGPQPGGDCLPLHNNIRNFGGHGWIPTKNPINTNPFN